MTELSEREEKLLVRYFDGEHSLLDALKVSRLMRRNPLAKDFLETMKVIGEIARNERKGIFAMDPTPVNLWDRVNSRIESEQRAALYLGERKTTPLSASAGIEKLKSWIGVSWDNVAWGSSGAFAAAAITVMLLGQGAPVAGVGSGVRLVEAQVGDLRNLGRNVRTVSVNRRQQSVNQVALTQGNDVLNHFATSEFSEAQGGNKSRTALVASNKLMPVEVLEEYSNLTAVEVNWMRSPGRVRMMQDPSEKGAIIWVKRRPQMQVDRNNLIPSYIATVDEPPENSAQDSAEPLVVYNNNRVPQGIPVGSFGR